MYNTRALTRSFPMLGLRNKNTKKVHGMRKCHAQTRTHTHTHTCTHTHTHTHTHTCTRARTQTHQHISHITHHTHRHAPALAGAYFAAGQPPCGCKHGIGVHACTTQKMHATPIRCTTQNMHTTPIRWANMNSIFTHFLYLQRTPAVLQGPVVKRGVDVRSAPPKR